ncbi:hypothetical protein WHR41_01209 [Cladosporium halotolerans]|uniref:Uncharacterized protein n=1 Tax=Cladosporium halotolerans TaxID=1052096 RepID=A0AB34L134_9PEZI
MAPSQNIASAPKPRGHNVKHKCHEYKSHGYPPRGSWTCCKCRQTNMPTLSPERCALDGHYKCPHCYVFR